MLASEIIRSLPDSLDWMVLFDLTPTTGRGGCSAAFPTGGLPPAIRSLERRSL
jgi:hypothetical protein